MHGREVFRRFLQEVSTLGLHNDEHHVLIALSGGLDSVVLLHLFLRAGFKTGTAHANFGLRGLESDNDMDFCRKLCERSGVVFHTKQFETHDFANSNKLSTQMAARILRYNWFESLIDSFKYDWLATGHQADDQAETVLLNLIDGRNPSTLAGIPQRRNNIVRPLLNITRENLLEYARENQICWREDSSNSLTEYKRNKIRHHILPELHSLNPAITETLHTLAGRMRQYNQLAEAQAAMLLEDRLKPNGSGYVLNMVGLLSHPALELLVQIALKPFGITAPLVADLLKSPLRSGRIVVTPTHNIRLDREQVFIHPTTDSNEKQTWILPEDCTELITAGFRLQISHDGDQEDRTMANTEKHIAMLDRERVHFPLTIGPWEKGDRFQPLGMNSFKKVSDYFIDRKVPVSEKERAVLIRSKGEIVWIAGDRIDHRYRVSPQTKAVLKLTFLRSSH